MKTSKNDGSNMEASIIKNIFEAAAEGNVAKVTDGFSLLPSLSKNCIDDRGWTPLMLAARNGHVDVVKALLQIGADPKIFNRNGQNATEIATFFNHAAVVKVFNDFLVAPSIPELELVNYFSHSVVDRQSYRRTDEDQIQSVMKSEKAKFVVFGDLKLLVTNLAAPRTGCRVLYFTWNEIENYLATVPKPDRDIIFLGVGDIEKGILVRETSGAVLDTFAYYAVNLKKVPTEDEFPVSKYNGEYVGRGPRGGRSGGIMALKREETGLVAQARSVLAWHEKYKFCPTCGHKTQMEESGYKRVCENSDCVSLTGAHNSSFPRTDPVVIVLVISTDGKKCMLGRQKRFPPGVYSCLAGFVEPGETIEDAARREVYEEAGVRVGKLQYHSSQPWPFPCSLMIGMIGNATSDEYKVDDVELEDARWFERSEVARAVVEGFNAPGLKIPPSTAIAHQLIKSWVKMSSNL